MRPHCSLHVSCRRRMTVSAEHVSFGVVWSRPLPLESRLSRGDVSNGRVTLRWSVKGFQRESWFPGRAGEHITSATVLFNSPGGSLFGGIQLGLFALTNRSKSIAVDEVISPSA